MKKDKDEMNEQVCESLARAGVAAEYRDAARSLRSLGTLGEGMADRLKSGDMRDSVSLGRVFVIEGVSKKSQDWMHLLVRGMLLHHIPVTIRSIDWVWQTSNPMIDVVGEWYPADCLAVEGFFRPDLADAYTGADINRMEWWLRDWLYRGKSLILGRDEDWNNTGVKWWSRSFINFVEDRTDFKIEADV